MEEFAAKLKRLRLAHGLTQAELAEKLLVSKQAVSKWETAKTMPDVELLPKIAAIYDMNLESLMSDDFGASARTINSASARTINSASARTINSASARTINSASARTINNASARTINSASARTRETENADNAGNIDITENDGTTVVNVPNANGAAGNAASGNGTAAADGGAQRSDSAENDSANKPKKKRSVDTKFLKNLILVCLPVLILVVVASVLLSVYLPDDSPNTGQAPVIQTPPVEDDPAPVFAELRAAGEDYYKRWNGEKYSFETEYKGGKAYFRFEPAFSSEYTFAIKTDLNHDIGWKNDFKDAKTTLRINYKAVAEIPFRESIEYKTYLKGGSVNEIVIETSSPNNTDKYTYMVGTIQVDYKHDFENVTVPAKSSYTVALPAENYVPNDMDESYSAAKTFRINNENLAFTSVNRMELLDPSMRMSYSKDDANIFWDSLYSLNYRYIELIMSLNDHKDFNNEFYYITITNDSDKPALLDLVIGDVEQLKRGEKITVQSSKNIKEDECKYKLYKIDLWESLPTGGVPRYNIFYSTNKHLNDVIVYAMRGRRYELDDWAGNFNHDNWYGEVTNYHLVCYVKLYYADEPYEFYVEPYI